MDRRTEASWLAYIRLELEGLLAKAELGCVVDWEAEVRRLLEATEDEGDE